MKNYISDNFYFKHFSVLRFSDTTCISKISVKDTDCMKRRINQTLNEIKIMQGLKIVELDLELIFVMWAINFNKASVVLNPSDLIITYFSLFI